MDSKHFPEPEELFTELATSEGCVLFECVSLLKATGIDLMDCPMQISLKLFVRRRLQQGTSLLYHMVLPLAVISKHLLQPPHEWDTWVGLLPSNASLEVCAPSDMFAHALVNLLADKVSPKLRLKFRASASSSAWFLGWMSLIASQMMAVFECRASYGCQALS